MQPVASTGSWTYLTVGRIILGKRWTRWTDTAGEEKIRTDNTGEEKIRTDNNGEENRRTENIGKEKN